MRVIPCKMSVFALRFFKSSHTYTSTNTREAVEMISFAVPFILSPNLRKRFKHTVNAYAKILPVKVLDSSGSGDTEQIANGIIYAADHGAKVINLSLGGPYSRVMEYALKYAASKNVTIVAATGNDGVSEISYPASSKYTHKKKRFADVRTFQETNSWPKSEKKG